MRGWLRRLLRAPADPSTERWVVVDVETSGLDASKDELISVGGVAMYADGRIRPADSIEIVFRRSAASSKDNILVHGIGVEAQFGGVDPVQATRHFLDFVGSCPLIAFHAPFDRAFIVRAVKSFAKQRLDNPWLDLAELAPALDPDAKLEALDEWLARYGIAVSARHSAAADAFATAMLCARLLPVARRQGATDLASLQRLARQGKWLNA